MLDRSLEPNRKLALVSAPAGYGKTTALAQWAQSRSAHIGWFNIDPEDNDFTRFFRYLVRVWERVHPDIMNSALGHLLGSINPDPAEIKTVFAEATAAAPAPTAIILNDYHLITAPAIHEALSYVIDHLPPHFHFILAVRGEPPLPLPRYQARAELLEIGTQELRFQKQETQELLGVLPGLSSTVIESLHQQTEGWAVGLQLVSLALQRGLADPEQPAAGGRQRFELMLHLGQLRLLRRRLDRLAMDNPVLGPGFVRYQGKKARLFQSIPKLGSKQDRGRFDRHQEIFLEREPGLAILG